MIPTSALRDLARRSVSLISSHQDAGGAYPASPVFPVYGYSWLRDGAFIADAMSRAGNVDSADRFFGWCARVLASRSDQIKTLIERADSGESLGSTEFLPTRFTLDGHDTGAAWWDFQLDGYGTWIWALVAHAARHGLPLDQYGYGIELSTRYICRFWRQPCFDWWEERSDDIHPSTLGSLLAGMHAALQSGLLDHDLARVCESQADELAELLMTAGVHSGHLIKSIGRTDVDASLIACMTPFDVVPVDSPLGAATYRKIRNDLAPDGVHRFVEDTYYGGGRWVVLAGFVGWHETRTGRRGEALRRLEWMHDQATSDGLLPEQVPLLALHPECIERWEKQWGPIATPLLWSHAMYITLAEALGVLDHEDS